MELIDKGSPVPCYHQVYKYLKDNIQNQTFLSGERLPSERILSEQFNVNRFTVRRAVENLIGEGLVYPVRRKGYYVKARFIDIPIHRKTSYTQNMLENNLNPKIKILEFETMDPDIELRDLFGLDGIDKLWSILILRYYGSIPMALSRCYLPYSRFSELNIYFAGDTSLYSILNKKYGLLPVRMRSQCEACLSDRKESRLLSILGNAPLLKVTSVAADQQGAIIEQSITKFRSDMVKLKIDLTDS